MMGGLQIPQALRAQCTGAHLICALDFSPQDERGSMVNPIDALVPVFARYRANSTGCRYGALESPSPSGTPTPISAPICRFPRALDRVCLRVLSNRARISARRARPHYEWNLVTGHTDVIVEGEHSRMGTLRAHRVVTTDTHLGVIASQELPGSADAGQPRGSSFQSGYR